MAIEIVAMKALGFCLSIFGLYLIYIGTVGPFVRGDGVDWQFALFGIVFGLPVLGLGSWLTSLADRSDQSSRNRTARKTLSGYISGASAPTIDEAFALYLRPFAVDGKFVAERETTNLFDLDQYDRVGTDALERVIGDAIKKTYQTIAIGQSPLEVSGVGEVGFLEDWKQQVAKLITGSSIIFLVPSLNSGTFWEVGEICRQRVLQKTIFIMPSRAEDVALEGDKNLADQWSDMRTSFETEFGFKMPVYKREGGFFRFQEGRDNPKFVTADTGGSPRSIAHSINKLL